MEVSLRSDGTLGFSDFSPAEALRIALRLEKDGIEFYSRCIGVFHDPGIRKAFEYLLASERVHLAAFERELDIETGVTGEEDASLAALVLPGVFETLAGSESLFEELVSVSDVVRMAVKIEEASMKFYDALLEKTEKPGGINMLKKILTEERDHLETLRDLVK